jgi:hypothetical protein
LAISGEAGLPLEGTKTVQHLVTTVYSLGVSVSAGDKYVGDFPLRSTTVTVPDPPKVVDITGSTREWARYLALALSKAETTVRLAPNVDMDLTGFDYIKIANGVQLLGGQPCPAPKFSSPPMPGKASLCGGRDAQHFGPRLFTQSQPQKLLFIDGTIDADHHPIRLSGFRLQGPHWDPTDGTLTGTGNPEIGIFNYGHTNVEIDDMELSGWAGAAITTSDSEEQHRQAVAGVQSVRVHDNYIHHNQHFGGYGTASRLAPHSSSAMFSSTDMRSPPVAAPA